MPRKYVVLVALAILAFAAVLIRAQGAAALPDVVPLPAPAPNQAAIDTFSWQTFVALNRPALLDGHGRPIRDNAFPNGKPDLTKPLDARGPRVWEGLKADHELFRHEGKEPVEWTEYDNDLPCAAGAIDEKSGEKILTLISEGTSMQQGINQAMAGPLIDRFGSYVHYEVRHNKPYYDFVRDKKFYLRSEVNKHRFPKKMIQLPISTDTEYGSLEIKAAWRILDASEDEAAANRYYWTWARVPDPVDGKCGPPQRVALVGLHIIQKVKGFNAWLWSTFEHVDNVPCNYTTPSRCPPEPTRYSFNDKGNTTLDTVAKSNRGYAPVNWTTVTFAKPNANPAKWRPRDPKVLPAEPVALADRIHAIRVTPIQPSADDRNAEFHAMAGIKDIDGAIAQIEGAIDAEPQLTFSYTNLGVLELKKGDQVEVTYLQAVAISLEAGTPAKKDAAPAKK